MKRTTFEVGDRISPRDCTNNHAQPLLVECWCGGVVAKLFSDRTILVASPQGHLAAFDPTDLQHDQEVTWQPK
jgi:hypothetical protein